MSSEQLILLAAADRYGRPVENVRTDLGAHRWSDPATSRVAASRQRGGAEAAALRLLEQWGPMTAEQVADVLQRDGWHPPTIISAVSRLRHRRLIRDTGQTRPSARGSPRIVWSAQPVEVA